MEQQQLLYLIEWKNKIIGAFNNLNDAETYIYGCFQNNFMTSAKIKIYKLNSCYLIDTKIYSSDSIGTPSNSPKMEPIKFNYQDNNISNVENKKSIDNNDENKKSIDDNDEAFIQMAEQKIVLQHKINMLKIQKDKMEESKRVFENDLKLFVLFNESKEKDHFFEIPELFKKKYDIMLRLKVNNNLTWEPFIKEYHVGENNYNDYFGLNNYEKLFLNEDDENNEKTSLTKFKAQAQAQAQAHANFNEELDIESDSDTESSDEEHYDEKQNEK
jgi:hypothetical protein